MISKFIKFSAAITLITLFTSCATTPNVQAPRPWTRTLGKAASIKTGSNIYINVSGQEEYLLLDNSLMDNSIYNVIKTQLNRRNFDIVKSKSAADYVFNVKYHSKDIQVMQTEVSSFQNSYEESASASGYGVLAALAVANQTSLNQSNKAKVSSHTVYRHTLGFSVTQNENMVWSGESTWKSNSVDISHRIRSVTQLLLSKLPGYGEVIPRVQAVNPDKKENYFNLFIKGNDFVCPSLPYVIDFKTSSTRSSDKPSLEGVSNPRILNAVVDLIQTAEYALPSDPNFENPISTSQWAKVNLGGEYYLGNDDQKTYIIVNLVGDKSGYKIDNASKVSRQEYNKFERDLKRWQNALSNYFQVFEQ